jgi:hypothetical protein
MSLPANVMDELGDVFAHHQEHLTVFTVSGNIHQCRCPLVSWMSWAMFSPIVRSI